MTARKLHISEQLSLPHDTVTSTLIVYGGKGMGKTNFGSVLAEECAAAGLRFAIIDPMGVWWGLRHSADGKGPGIEVLILGGIHGDIPIEPTGGAVVADLVVDEDANCVIDISRRPDGTMWSIAERVRFVRDYCKRLYQRQGEKRRPLLQGIDEAARFIPQIVRKEEGDVAACMGAIAVLVEEGRNVGVGVCLITQRSARLNKDVAELADCMVAFRTLGPNSRRAVMEWLGEHVEKDRAKELSEGVRKLPRGSALVVSPGWLEFEGIVPIRMRQTFDSSATPKVGQQVRASGPGAKPDLAKYQARMAETIERAKADDPKELKKLVTELEKQLRAKTPAPAKVQTSVKPDPAAAAEHRQVRAENTALQQHVTQLKSALERLMKFIVEIHAKDFFTAGGPAVDQAAIMKALEGAASQITRLLENSMKLQVAELEKARRQGGQLVAQITNLLNKDVHVTVAVKHNEPFTVTPQASRPPRAAPATGSADLPEGMGNVEQNLLNQLAELEAMGLTPADKQQLGLFAGYTNIRSGGFSEPMGRLVRAGLIQYPSQGTVTLTEAGRAVAKPTDIPSTTEDLQERILAKLDGPRAKLLRELITLHPTAISKAELGTRCGYTNIRSGGFSEPLGSLRTLGLVEYPTQGEVRASDALFLESAAR